MSRQGPIAMTQTLSKDRETGLAAALIETLQMPAIVIDGDGSILAANRVAHGQLGTLRLGEALTLSLRAPDILDSVARVQAGGAAEIVTWRPRVPVERVFEVSVAAIGTRGFEKHVVITLRDLTEAHRVERMRVDFVANVSHELRTPLASVLGFIETLQGPARDDPKVRDRFLEIMRDQGRRMARLIDDLKAGRTVVFNSSRAMVAEAQAKFPGTRVVLVEATPEVRARRLGGRGRENEAEIAARLAREVTVALPGAIRVDNSGPLDSGIEAFLAALRQIAAD